MEHNLWTSTFFYVLHALKSMASVADVLRCTRFCSLCSWCKIYYTIPYHTILQAFQARIWEDICKSNSKRHNPETLKVPIAILQLHEKKFSLLQPLLQPGGRVILYCVDKAFPNHHEQAMIPDDTMNFMVTQNLHYCITDYLCHHIARSVSVKTLYRWSVVIYGWCKASSITFGR